MSKPLGPYTPVVRAGDWIIVSGQLGMKDGALVAGGVAAQTAQAVENLTAQLATMGATLADVAKTLCFLTDMDTFATFNEAYVAGFGDSRPARSTIGVAALPARRCGRDRGLGLQACVTRGLGCRRARCHRHHRRAAALPRDAIMHGSARCWPPCSATCSTATPRCATRAANCST